ncbi:hypothetical protein JVT61DRAFT_1131 [Boletus reticuloceps]|uniref:Ribosomal RNA-processing protein 40 n=1 Tax=Boletus reticuloceps TaxID=495285 RepID=A0A8I2YRC6_9AGAM|nr:hypothetical protein JVT61DRAFT_1131 [Boletus reticuloceps]
MASIVVPGEHVPAQHVNLKLGPGLLQLSAHRAQPPNSHLIISTRAGQLDHSANKSRWWVECNARRYVPASQESVIGIVLGRSGDGWRVDIGSGHPALLDGLAFEGATRRSKPNLKVRCQSVSHLSNQSVLQVGALVYARVSLAHKDMEPELECFDAQTHKAEGFGELSGGFVMQCSLRMSRLLLDPKHFLLPFLGSRFPLEVAVGMNGRTWISAKGVKQTIAVVRCIEAVDPDGAGMEEGDLKKLFNRLEI